MSVVTAEMLLEPDRKVLTTFRTWKRFRAGYRNSGAKMLSHLRSYPDAVLVAGCQRSGTTMLTRLLTGSSSFGTLRLTHDDELDAALVLSGLVSIPRDRRYCFQTTYVNENYAEYESMGENQRLIWLVRNPFAVVRSMVSNWKRFALRELYEFCGDEPVTRELRSRRIRYPWPIGLSPVEQACYAYAGKAAQLKEISCLLGVQRLMVVDYDQVTRHSNDWVPALAEFANVDYQDLSNHSMRVGKPVDAEGFTRKQRMLIEQIAMPVYRESLKFVEVASCVA